jgi:hypothetical protein
MKRFQFMIEEDLERDLDRMARREHCSKATLIRRFIREKVEPLPPLEEDPITSMIGVDDVDYGDIDAVVYR